MRWRAGSVATLRFKAKWLHGWPEALLRLNGNWLEATGTLPIPANLGTPGSAEQRRDGECRAGDFQVAHAAAVPPAGQPLVVTTRVHDADAVSSLYLHYRIDPNLSYAGVPMNDSGTAGDAIAGDGIFSATIPARRRTRWRRFM